MLLNHHLRRRMQKSRAAVVAKPLPRGEHFAFWSLRERLCSWKSRHEVRVLVDHARHLCLLQHQLAYEGAVARALMPPRKVARAPCEPLFDGGRDDGDFRDIFASGHGNSSEICCSNRVAASVRVR